MDKQEFFRRLKMTPSPPTSVPDWLIRQQSLSADASNKADATRGYICPPLRFIAQVLDPLCRILGRAIDRKRCD